MTEGPGIRDSFPPSTPAALAPGQRARFRRALVGWYRRNARPLPWRATADPYRIWISEVMLQQTTVTAVVPYFERFLGKFPSVERLAAASEQEVLRAWEGLGYYSRARNIHRAARLIADERSGRFPDSVAALRELPGIGRYTAGAIVSFAFDRPAPIVEANTLRLYSRLLGFRGDPRSAGGQRTLWEFAESIVPARSPGRFNQALMELGAKVCTPERPGCERCPVSRWCAAFALGAQSEIPREARRVTFTEVTETAIVVHREGRFLLQRRAPGERWAGLWDFVRFAVGEKQKAESGKRKRMVAAGAGELERRVAEEAGVQVEVGELLTELRHGVTRYRITLRCHLAQWRSGEPSTAKRESRWVLPRELGSFPLSTTGRKIARLLQERIALIDSEETPVAHAPGSPRGSLNSRVSGRGLSAAKSSRSARARGAS